jgi:putative Holliday junction resolvase
VTAPDPPRTGDRRATAPDPHRTGAILGIDLGERRIGLAIAEADGVSARPLATVNRARSLAPADDAGTLARIVAEQRVTELVVGLPLEAAGTHGPMAEAATTWAQTVAGLLGLPLTMRDERLSSHLAQERLGPMPRGRGGGPPSKMQRDRYRERVDREAAAIILQDELDARRDARGDARPGTGNGPLEASAE